MKVRLLGVFIMTLAILVGIGGPAWSQEATTAQEATTVQEAATTQDVATTQETATAQEAVTTQDEAMIKIENVVVCQDVVDREPVGSGDVFAKENTTLYCYTRVVGATTDTQITHNWYFQGNLQASVKLNVRSSNWRTWSSKTMMPEMVGEWMVEILSEDGKPMESIVFVRQ